jgi:serine/threonine protein kinase
VHRRATLNEGFRFCPICREAMEESVCPADKAATIPWELARRDPSQHSVGEVFAGRYRIGDELGKGGYGRVYAAIQLGDGRTLALKMMQPRVVSDEELLQRFYVEARAASRLRSPHVVRIYDYGIDEESCTPYIAMEELEGRSLADEIGAKGCLGPRQTARILGHVARALVAAGDQGIVHRDLKPENVLLASTAKGDCLAKVTDFGIAKLIGPENETEPSLTATGMTVGTPAYMAPEQVEGVRVDARTDLYALGCMLHECVMGEPPFGADDQASLLAEHLVTRAPKLPDLLPSGDALPEALGVLHDALLAKSPRDRPSSARPVVKVLSAVERGQDVDAIELLSEGRETGPRGRGGSGEQPVPMPASISLDDEDAEEGRAGDEERWKTEAKGGEAVLEERPGGDDSGALPPSVGELPSSAEDDGPARDDLSSATGLGGPLGSPFSSGVLLAVALGLAALAVALAWVLTHGGW